MIITVMLLRKFAESSRTESHGIDEQSKSNKKRTTRGHRETSIL